MIHLGLHEPLPEKALSGHYELLIWDDAHDDHVSVLLDFVKMPQHEKNIWIRMLGQPQQYKHGKPMHERLADPQRIVLFLYKLIQQMPPRQVEDLINDTAHHPLRAERTTWYPSEHLGKFAEELADKLVKNE